MEYPSYEEACPETVHDLTAEELSAMAILEQVQAEALLAKESNSQDPPIPLWFQRVYNNS